MLEKHCVYWTLGCIELLVCCQLPGRFQCSLRICDGAGQRCILGWLGTARQEFQKRNELNSVLKQNYNFVSRHPFDLDLHFSSIIVPLGDTITMNFQHKVILSVKKTINSWRVVCLLIGWLRMYFACKYSSFKNWKS